MPLDLNQCDKICHDCVKSYIKKHKLKKGDAFEVLGCQGIPKEYIPPDILSSLGEDPETVQSMLDPVTWARKWLDWHCFDPEGKEWLRKYEEGTLGGLPKYDEARAKTGRSIFHRPYQLAMLRCLHGDSKVFMGNGIIKNIKDIQIGDTVVTYNENKKSTQHTYRVTNKWINGVKDIYLIKLENGDELKVTSNHPILSWFHDGKFNPLVNKKSFKRVYKSIDDGLDVGDKVYTLNKFGLYGEIDNPNLAKLLGYIVTDGYVQTRSKNKGNNIVEFRNIRKQYVEEFQFLLKKVFNIDASIKYNPERLDKEGVFHQEHWSISVYGENSALIQFLKTINCTNPTNRELSILKYAFKFTKESLVFFINRCWSGDGCVYCYDDPNLAAHRATLTFCSGNQDFLENYRYLLKKVGIYASHIYTDEKEDGSISKVINIGRIQDIITFFKFCGPIFGKEKESQLALQSSCKRYGINPFRRHGSLKTLSRTKIIDIEYCGQDVVYDIEVNTRHNFIANGLVVHNCTASRKVFRIGRQCLTENTFITLADKTVEKIIDILPQENIQSLSLPSHKIENDIVVDVWPTGIRSVFVIKTKYGKEIECTSDHPLWTLSKKNSCSNDFYYSWKTIGSGLKIGDKLATEKPFKTISQLELQSDYFKQDIFWDPISSIEHLGPKQTYDIETVKNHNFFANGIVVHNCGKTETLCISILFHIFTHENFHVEIIAPYQAQIDLIFKRLMELINSNQVLANSIARSVKAPQYTVELKNGSMAIGFTAGTRSKQEAGASRGQHANMLVFDEADYLSSADIDAALAVIINYPDATVWMSSTPTGRREKFYDSCFTESALIRKGNELVQIKDIKKNDLVLTTNNRYKKVLQVMNRYIDEEIIKLQVYYHNFEDYCYVTKNHPFLTDKGWKVAKDLTFDDYIAIPINKIEEKFNKRPVCRLLPFTKQEKKRKKIIDLYETNSTSQKISNIIGVSRHTVTDIIKRYKVRGKEAFYDSRKINAIKMAQDFIDNINLDDPRFYRLAGYYLAEGCLHRYLKYQYWSGISFSFHAKELEYHKEVVELVKHLTGLKANLYFYEDNKALISANANWLANAFYTLFGHSENKSIPNFMLGHENEIQLVDTAVKGDGHLLHNDTWTISLTAKQTILQIRDICLRNGIPVSFTKNKEISKKKTYYSLNKLYTGKNWKYCNGQFYCRIFNIQKDKYKGTVYNLEVEEDHTYTANLLGVHNCNNKQNKEFHFPSTINPNWTPELETYFRSELTSDGYDHEILAIFGEQEEGVYQLKYVEAAQSDYEYKDIAPNSSWTYMIGVDWNDFKIGTTIAVVGHNHQDNTLYLVDKYIIARAERTQLAACQKIAEINRLWNTSYIYVDQGYGSTQIEILHDYGARCLSTYGPNHPDSRLRNIVKGYDSGSNVDIRDLFTKQIVKKPAKPFMIENSVRRFESLQFKYPKSDKDFTAQLLGYIVDRVSITGRPVYRAQNESVGDHFLDAVNLALVAFTLEKSSFGKVNYVPQIAIAGKFGDPEGAKLTNKTSYQNTALEHRPKLGRSANIGGNDKIFPSPNGEVPGNHMSQDGSTKLWSWDGFLNDGPKPQVRSLRQSFRQAEYKVMGKKRTNKPTRKKF